MPVQRSPGDSRTDPLRTRRTRRVRHPPPLTATGTSSLGLAKHLPTVESRYFGEVFDRPFPEPLPRWDDAGEHDADRWAAEHDTRSAMVDRHRRARHHSDATITTLAIGSPGPSPWWPRPDVKIRRRRSAAAPG
ncbi:DUF664 domain-containing protein [Streptomyces sp. NPDC101223]|uniref:mycothiol transferase n=1 Tax=Streptomyces sp. NPDC101223 TaxID=3366133 RepID=UPI00383023E5